MEQEIQLKDKLLEFNRFGLICAILLIVGCLGGVTIGLGAVTFMPALILVTITTMTTLALIISVSPMKWIMNSAIVSVVVDVILIIVFAII
ncbi:MAG: hypothetical protein HYU67_07540 [Flavobacteriia bacterium]|nr:hypothetical protein [Flavobacteriia bacterium]